jgi:hypothetical protein
MRDFASINELTVLSNLESFNSELIKSKLDKQTRFNNLYRIAKQQLEILNQKDFIKSVKKISDNTYLDQ